MSLSPDLLAMQKPSVMVSSSADGDQFSLTADLDQHKLCHCDMYFCILWVRKSYCTKKKMSGFTLSIIKMLYQTPILWWLSGIKYHLGAKVNISAMALDLCQDVHKLFNDISS